VEWVAIEKKRREKKLKREKKVGEKNAEKSKEK
jgi:hypothetical protein